MKLRRSPRLLKKAMANVMACDSRKCKLELVDTDLINRVHCESLADEDPTYNHQPVMELPRKRKQAYFQEMEIQHKEEDLVAKKIKNSQKYYQTSAIFRAELAQIHVDPFLSGDVREKLEQMATNKMLHVLETLPQITHI